MRSTCGLASSQSPRNPVAAIGGDWERITPGKSQTRDFKKFNVSKLFCRHVFHDSCYFLFEQIWRNS